MIEVYRYRSSNTLQSVLNALKAIKCITVTKQSEDNVNIFIFQMAKGITGNDAHYAEQVIAGLIGLLGDDTR